MVSEDLKIVSIINDYFVGLLPNLTFEVPENVLCEISYTGDLKLFLWQWKSTKVILALENSKRNEKKYKFIIHFFLIARCRKTNK